MIKYHIICQYLITITNRFQETAENPVAVEVICKSRTNPRFN